MVNGKVHRGVTCAMLVALIEVPLWFAGCAPATPIEAENIILISIDTCRADHLSSYGYDGDTTPNIDALARDGILFENVISPIPITLPSHSSIMTGTIPPYHGVRDNADYRLDGSMFTLAELVKRKGYQTAAFVGAIVLDSHFGLNQGFDTYDDRFAGDREDIFVERKGEEVSRLANAWLEENRDVRNFLFLHYFDPHANYRPPEPFATTFADEPYAGEVAYTDWCIGQVLDKLKALDLYDSSLILITADHGEALGEHSEVTHAYYIYQSTLRVPLIVKLPGSHEASRVRDMVSLIDIMPTVLDFLEIPIPPEVQGESLSPLFSAGKSVREPQPIYCESLLATKYGCSSLIGVLDGRWKYIETTHPELYDLQEDPGETVNLVESEADNARRLQNHLMEILAQQTREQTSGARTTIDEATRSRLRALGYLPGGTIREEVAIDQVGEDPKDFFPYYHKLKRAEFLYVQHQFSEAKMLANQLVSERPQMVPALALMGNIHFDEANLERASYYFSQALQNDPDFVDTLIDLGVVLAQQGKLEQSLSHLSKALRLNPSSEVAHNNMGNALASGGRLEEAVQHYEEALGIDPAYADAHLNLCRVFAMQKKLDEALQHCREASRLEPGWTEAEEAYHAVSRSRLESH